MSETVKIHGEDCERVTSFGDLRCMDVVWFLSCEWCGKDHRYWLVELLRDTPTVSVDGIHRLSTGWSVLPLSPCVGHARRRVITGVASIPAGRLFRVVNPPRAGWADDYSMQPNHSERKQANQVLREYIRQVSEQRYVHKKRNASEKG